MATVLTLAILVLCYLAIVHTLAPLYLAPVNEISRPPVDATDKVLADAARERVRARSCPCNSCALSRSWRDRGMTPPPMVDTTERRHTAILSARTVEATAREAARRGIAYQPTMR